MVHAESSPAGTAGPGRFSISDDEFEKLRSFIHTHTGIALSEHKRALICSRLGKRLRAHRLPSFGDYYRLLVEGDASGTELVEMINCITTNKTEFFREADHFTFLEQQLFRPAVAAGKTRLRLWSAAASTGEEAYTLAIVAAEAAAGARLDVKILATDIDTAVLEHAQRGIYALEQARNVPPSLLHRYFYKGVGANVGAVMIKPVIAEYVRFRRLNLHDATWPFEGGFDAILCRNVLMYFDRAGQKNLISRLVGCLNPGGYLLVGHSEALCYPEPGLRHVGQSIYQTMAER